MVSSYLKGLSFVVTKQIADSVGHEDLSMTFDELLERKISNLSYQYVDLLFTYITIRVSRRGDFRLYSKVRKNPFAAQLVRHYSMVLFLYIPSKRGIFYKGFVKD